MRRGLLKCRPAAAFLPVQLMDETATPCLQSGSPLPRLPKASAGSEGKIEITLPDGSHLQVGSDVSLAALRRVMTALRG